MQTSFGACQETAADTIQYQLVDEVLSRSQCKVIILLATASHLLQLQETREFDLLYVHLFPISGQAYLLTQ